jgi:predicted amidophosphoribosyltransferase
MKVLPWRRRESTAEQLVAQLRPSFALTRALLCLDCQNLYEADGRACPSCGSGASILASRLDRPPVPLESA